MTDDLLGRLHERLLDALRARGLPVDRPVTAEELYEDLVPYAAVRDPLGLALHADYEHLVMRLLAGEGSLARLEPADAREEIRLELERSGPDLGLFRLYADHPVWIGPAAGGAMEPGMDPGTEAGSHGTEPDAVPAPPAEPVQGPQSAWPDGSAVRRTAPVRLHRDDEPAPGDARSAILCAFCSDPLPKGRPVRFCPHCGGDQRLSPCPRCGAALEPGWRFCIGCGRESDPD